MSLPNSIDPTTPVGTSSPAQGDDELRGIKQYLVDVFGVPNGSSVTAAAGTVSTAGVVSILQTPFTVPTLLQGTASQILRVESQYSNLLLGVNGTGYLVITPTGVLNQTPFSEWASGVTGSLGTQGAQPLILRTAAIDRWQINPSGMLMPMASNLDIGSVSGPNPRNLYVASNIVVGGALQWGNEILQKITPSRGALLFRGVSGWLNLEPGTTGQFLQTAGSGGDPGWITGSAGPGSVALTDSPVLWTGRHSWNGPYNFVYSNPSAMLGVGTSSPTQMLHVAGRGFVASHLDIGGNLTVAGSLAGSLTVTSNLNVTGTATISTNLNVLGTAIISNLLGIGTSAPTQMLHVFGRGYVGSHLDLGGQLKTGAANKTITTPTGLLDLTQGAVSNEAQGDVLIRSSVGWTGLAAGSSGFFLQTRGSGAVPAYASVTALESGTWTADLGPSGTTARAIDTTYQNTSGKKRRVCIVGYNATSGAFWVFQSDTGNPASVTRAIFCDATGAGSGDRRTFTVEVPSGWYYRATQSGGTGVIVLWFELDE